MGMIGYAKAGGEMARVFRLLTATVGMLAILPISAESADDLKLPASFRNTTKQCFECHQPKKDQDYVYSTYIP
jgi:hypothetical protein